MAWYYYSGKIVRPIPVSKGKSVSVRTGSKVEILELTDESKALISKGELRITGRPKDASSDNSYGNTSIKNLIKESDMRKTFERKSIVMHSDVENESAMLDDNLAPTDNASVDTTDIPESSNVDDGASSVDEYVKDIEDDENLKIDQSDNIEEDEKRGRKKRRS